MAQGLAWATDDIAMPRTPTDLEAWLRRGPSVDELRSTFPAEWEAISAEVAEIARTSGLSGLSQLTDATSHPVQVRGAASKQARVAAAQAEIRRRLMVAALRQIGTGYATGVTGRVRFNLFNGWMFQRALFEQDLVRKPVSVRRFHRVWRLCWQRRYLMALVQPRGIYCFYSSELVAALREIIGARSCIEIAAGDGTLSRFLTDAGTPVVATDDYSWSDRVRFNDAVKKQDARTALRVHQPQVVLCSWPPAGNKFERDVFASNSVQTYIVITSQHEFAAGDWNAYRDADGWEMTERPDLAALVLPHELDNAVYIFERREE